MRNLIFVSVLTVLFNNLSAQADCDASRLINEGKAAIQVENYELAQNKFNSARRCDPVRGSEIDLEVKNLVAAIEQKKVQAERERRRAEEQTKLALAAQAATKAALDSLAILNADKVRLMLAEVGRNQKELNFDAAIDKLNTARILQSMPDSVEQAYVRLIRAMLTQARRDLKGGDYHSGLKKVISINHLTHRPPAIEAPIQQFQYFLFENIRNDILNIQSNAAVEKTMALISLGVSADTARALLFELAYCYAEAGLSQRSLGLLDAVAKMKNDPIVPSSLQAYPDTGLSQQMQFLRQMQQQLEPQLYRFMKERYLPTAFSKIPGGSFVLGSTAGSVAGACRVIVQPFQIGIKEVSFYEYDLFCAATGRAKPDDHFWGREAMPVIDVSWYDALAYCNWRSRQEGLQEVYQIDTITNHALQKQAGTPAFSVRYAPLANGYRLPTEAEWAFAAGNGGEQTRYSWGNTEPVDTRVGNLADASVQTRFPEWKVFNHYTDGYTYTAPTGSFPPNSFGLYDMSGNVWEWCWDHYADNFCKSNKHRAGSKRSGSGAERVLRGGAWGSLPEDCPVQKRFHSKPATHNFSIGFRLAKNHAATEN